ncbi:MAG: hypothetical protein HW421_3671 [Ignavibacteria bacterium]|nr:hypothetical protein [Ignavibacteria bacterium]
MQTGGSTFITPTLTTTTTYFVTRYNTTTNCESATRSSAVATINSTLSEPTATGASRCGSGSVTLSASGAQAGEDYKWYSTLTGGTLLQTNGNTFATPAITTTTVYFVVLYNTTTLCESNSRIAVVATINQQPTPGITGEASVNRNGVYTYTSNNSNVQNSWTVFGGTPTTGTGNQIIVTWGTGSSGTVVLQQTSEGCSASSSKDITMINYPQLSISVSNKNTCYGTSTQIGPVVLTGGSGTINDGSTVVTSFKWSPTTGLANNTSINPTVTNAVYSSYYSVTVTDIYANMTAVTSMYLNVRSNPTVTLPAYVMTRRSLGVMLNSKILSNPSGSTPRWTSDQAELNEVSGTITQYPFSSRRYYLRVRDSYNCLSSLYQLYVYVTGPKYGDNELEFPVSGFNMEDLFFTYPNPTTDVINIEAVFVDKSNIEIKLINLVGKEYLRINPGITDYYEGQLDISHVPAGAYLLIIEANGQTYIKKVIKN